MSRPEGLVPRTISEMNYCLDRCRDITNATYRYTLAGIEPPESWVEEYRYLQDRYMFLEKRTLSRLWNLKQSGS